MGLPGIGIEEPVGHEPGHLVVPGIVRVVAVLGPEVIVRKVLGLREAAQMSADIEEEHIMGSRKALRERIHLFVSRIAKEDELNLLGLAHLGDRFEVHGELGGKSPLVCSQDRVEELSQLGRLRCAERTCSQELLKSILRNGRTDHHEKRQILLGAMRVLE